MVYWQDKRSEYYNNKLSILIVIKFISILVNQGVGKFKDKLKLQNAITLEKDKEKNNFTFISDGPLTTVNWQWRWQYKLLHWFDQECPFSQSANLAQQTLTIHNLLLDLNFSFI